MIYPSLIDGLAEKYGFLVSPGEDDVFDEEKGIVFEDGAWNNIAIDSVTIFSDGIVIDTRSSTTDSEAIFNEALEWASTSYGLTYKPEMVSRKRCVSEVVIRSVAALSGLNRGLEIFSDQLSAALNNFANIDTKFELNSVGFHYDASELKIATAPFKIERLENVAYSDNKYYSVAPLPTEEHLRLLEEFEMILTQS